jgi:hypothetical protein
MTLVILSCPLVGTLVKLSVAVVGDAGSLDDTVVSPEVYTRKLLLCVYMRYWMHLL